MNSAISPQLMEEVRLAFEQKSDLPSPVHVTDLDGQFLFANTEARELFGLGYDLSEKKHRRPV